MIIVALLSGFRQRNPAFYVREPRGMAYVTPNGRIHPLRFSIEFSGHVSSDGKLAFLDDDHLWVYKRNKVVYKLPVASNPDLRICGWSGSRIEYEVGGKKMLFDPATGRLTPTTQKPKGASNPAAYETLRLKLKMDSISQGRKPEELIGARPNTDMKNPQGLYPPTELYLINSKTSAEKRWLTLPRLREVVCFSLDKTKLYTIRWNRSHDNVGLIATDLTSRNESTVVPGAIWAQPIVNHRP